MKIEVYDPVKTVCMKGIIVGLCVNYPISPEVEINLPIPDYNGHNPRCVLVYSCSEKLVGAAYDENSVVPELGETYYQTGISLAYHRKTATIVPTHTEGLGPKEKMEERVRAILLHYLANEQT